MSEILQHLDGLKKTGSGYLAQCPAHKDNDPSLTVSIQGDGKVLLHCFAGCSVHDILGSLGLPYSVLFGDDNFDYQLNQKNKKTLFDRKQFMRDYIIAKVAEADALNGKKLNSTDTATAKASIDRLNKYNFDADEVYRKLSFNDKVDTLMESAHERWKFYSRTKHHWMKNYANTISE